MIWLVQGGTTGVGGGSMVDMTAISGMTAAIKNMLDVWKVIVESKSDSDKKGLILEFQTKLLAVNMAALDAQTEQVRLQERIRELEKRIGELESWEKERERYKIKEVANGGFAYIVKNPEEGECEIFLCANCFDRKEKSILQRMPIQAGLMLGNGDKLYRCPRCESKIYVNPFRELSPRP